MNSNVLRSRNPISRLLSCYEAPTGIWNLGHMRLPQAVLQAVLADLGGWNSPSGLRAKSAKTCPLVPCTTQRCWSGKQPEANVTVCSQSEICFDFCYISQWQDSYPKNHTAKPWYFSYTTTTAQVLVILVLNSNPPKMNPLELSSQNGDGFRTRKMQRWNMGPVMLKNVAKFFS